MSTRGHNRNGKTAVRGAAGFRMAPLAQALALMLVAGGAAGSAHAAPAAFSSGWFAAKGANQSQARANGVSPASLIPTGAQQSQQAQQKLTQSINNLARVASGIAAQQAAQNAARLAAMGAPSDVPDGLAANGLSADKDNAWINAQLGPDANDPSRAQTVDPRTGHVTVTVQQNSARAIANWSSFNVGKNTTLHFDQSAGTQTNGANNWAILNRVNDPQGKPSQILGQITAEGSVYVINRNGIIFGGASQVNVHSLLASTLDFLNSNDHLVQTPADIAASNQLFLGQTPGQQGGLASLEAGSTHLGQTGNPNEVLGLGYQVNVTSAGDYAVPGDVTIAPGARISTQTTGTVSDGGFVLIAAPHVANGGAITADGGQVVLAAGVGVSLRPSPNPQIMVPELSGQLTIPTGQFSSQDVTPAGALVNTGFVGAARGEVDLLGSSVTQNGIAQVTTSVNTAGAITISTVDEYYANTPIGISYLGPNTRPIDTSEFGGANDMHRAGELVFGNGSITAVLADGSSPTATSTPGVTFTPGSISVTAGSAWLRSGSLIEAPGASVSITALTASSTLNTTPPGGTAVPGRVLVDTGATIDVSGLADVELPMSDLLVTIARIGQNELADSPLQRNSALFGLQNVVIDSTLSGTRADGTPWVGSPVLNAQGYVDLVPRSIDQLMTRGGTINLAGNEVMTAAGSSLNVSGGYTHYLGGDVTTTRVVDQYGRMVPIGQVDPNAVIVGAAGQYVENHSRWGVSTTWTNPLLNRPVYEDEFVVGDDAGTVNVFGSSAVVLDGAMNAQVVSGSKQVENGSQPLGGTFGLGSAKNIVQSTQGPNTSNGGQAGLIVIADKAPDLSSLAPGFSIDTPLDQDALAQSSDTAALAKQLGVDPGGIHTIVVIPADTLNAGGFSSVTIRGNRNGYAGVIVAAGTDLDLQAGGTFSITGPIGGANPQSTGALDVEGSIRIPSGTFSFTGGGDITVGPAGSIDVAGQWVNNDPLTAPGSTAGGSQYIDGGSISLTTAGGDIDLKPGSLLDVSSGGEMQADGRLLMAGGLPAGLGGDVTLTAHDQPIGYALTSPPNGVELDGTIRGFGFQGGGTLSIQTTDIQIGGARVSLPDSPDPRDNALWLPADFFARQGFGDYVLNALYDITVAPGSNVRLTQQNLIPNIPSLQQAASGSDLWQGGLTAVGTVDPYYRQATSLTLIGADYLWGGPNLANNNGASQPIPLSYAGLGAVTVGQGAAVVGDAGAHIDIASGVQITVLGSLVAHGGEITLSADTGSADQFELAGQFSGVSGFTSASKSVWLGSDSVLDVSGVAPTDPFPQPVRSGSSTFPPDTGKVLDGGSVTLSDDSGYIVAQAGAVIDVSGISASFDQQQANGVYAAQPVWSNAGSITIAASSGLYFDGTLRGQGGAPQADSGTLALVPVANGGKKQELNGVQTTLPGATALVIQQGGELAPAGLQPGQDFIDDPLKESGVLRFAADRLAGSGIDTLLLGGTGAPGFSHNTVPVVFSGAVALNLGRAVEIYTGTVAAISQSDLARLLPSFDASSGKWLAAPTTLAALLDSEARAGDIARTGTDAHVDAPYVAFEGPLVIGTGTTPMTPVRAAGDGALTVDASFIDLVNQFQLNGFAQATFSSKGDIRLSSANQGQVNGNVNSITQGELYTPGNLTFAAADLYPATGTTFILDAVGPNGTDGKPLPTSITFQSNGVSSTPLSAGGTLLVDATTIVQGGTVRAPSGSLIFGVGDTTDAATQALFNSMPLVATESVTLAAGSVTSVSNGGLVIPYGTTVDGVEWQFNPIPNLAAAPDLSGPPSKYIGVNGSSVALSPGATIDLSGGGDLQAQEWVPGTGGSRDVLSQYNVSYETSAGGTAIPLLSHAANIYAIVPGAQSPVAAYDPILAQTLQPSLNADRTTGTTTKSIGVGLSALDGTVGQAIYLQGVPGLADGVYTLLPAKYATLPGAYRVTVAGGTAVPGGHASAPDGTQVVAGYWADALSGARAATPTLFDVQSGATWQQYSQYTLTPADNFFTRQALQADKVVPSLAMDAGQLVLAASRTLSLGAKLNTAAAAGGAPAQVDIASQDIQIVGQGEAALPGYLQISAGDLDALGAGSLLIGGTRTHTTDGISIDAIANSVVVSNDAAHPLTGPEIILVTKTDGDSTIANAANNSSAGTSGTDPNAANGLRIDSGSVIAATGAYPAGKDVPITIGAAPDASGNGGVPGDGALLMVSNGAPVTVARVNTTDAADNDGLLAIAAGASLQGGQSLVLDSSGDVRFDPAAALSGNTIAVDGSRITFTDKTGTDAAAIPGFVIGAAQIAQLAQARTVVLRSYGAMVFDGNIDARFGNDVDLSAGVFEGTGGNVVIEAPAVAFTNEAGATVPDALTRGAGSLTVNAGEIDLGVGDKSVSGFGTVTFNASTGIVGQNTGTFNFGALPITMSAPVYLADTGSNAGVTTTGELDLNVGPGTALDRAAAGGALSFTGGTVKDNGATILAPAGNVSIEAASGDLDIAAGSLVSAAGIAKTFFDIVAASPAGSITLISDTGVINVAAGATLDFSGAASGGKAGSLTLSAPVQTVNLAGTVKGGAAAGFQGGSFTLTTGGAVDLDSLARLLAASGVNDSISVDSKTGNLVLSAGNRIVARSVSLTADGGAGGQDPDNGQIVIQGTIDASGAAGGEIDLYGKSGVEIDGTLLALACLPGGPCDDAHLNPNQRGGTVNIGTTATGSPNDLNSTYGYENISSAQSGWITLGVNALIDVSGGTAGGLSGGTVNFRAPLVDTATGPGSVNVRADAGARIVGSRATTVEAYAVWSTDDHNSNADQHFDGIVDPAGWYDSSGHLLQGTFTSQDGSTTFTFTPDGSGGGTVTNTSTAGSATLTAGQLQSGDSAIGFGGLASNSFAPDTPNAAHEVFYGYQGDGSTPGTLMSFVQQGVAGAANSLGATPFVHFANFAVVPGIELDNPDAAINNGNISVVTNWNLGAGTDAGLAFRFRNQAPVITFRAENNVNVNASLTDGFFQIANPTNPGSSNEVTVPGYLTHDALVHEYYYQTTSPYAYSYYFVDPVTGRTLRSGEIVYYSSHNPNAKYQNIAYGPGTPTGTILVDPVHDTLQGEIDAYLALYTAYADFLLSPAPAVASLNPGNPTLLALATVRSHGGPVVEAPPAPSAATQASNPLSYVLYLQQYSAYLVQNYFSALQNVQPPAVQLDAMFRDATGMQIAAGTSVALVSPAPVTNSVALLATRDNPLPLASASLTGGSSTSFRVVAGADTASANPLAVQAATLFNRGDNTQGSVTLDGHAAYTDANGGVILTPTTIRTGTGSIDIAAGNDVALLDSTAPGVIYTAGQPANGGVQGTDAVIVKGTLDPDQGLPDILVSPTVNPEGAGDISIQAQGNITGIEWVTDDAAGTVSGKPNNSLSQFWWQWMEVSPTPITHRAGDGTYTFQPLNSTSIDFGAFDQGVMSVGGNVSIRADGDIADLAVSLPSTWYRNADGVSVTTVGGGNLAVHAGGDILSGDYFVAKGTGTIQAGGKIASDLQFQTRTIDHLSVPLATFLATQDGNLDVSARQGVALGGIFDPSYIQPAWVLNTYTSYSGQQPYSSTSSVSVTATTGDVDLGTPSALYFVTSGSGSPQSAASDYSFVLPATLDLYALNGGISIMGGGQLFPSATGQLNLIADRDVNFSTYFSGVSYFGMSDQDPGAMPSPQNTNSGILALTAIGNAAHSPAALHGGDTDPARIYSLEGSIVDGILEPQGTGSDAGFYDNLMNVVVDKPALIQAGRDILNLAFQGQNLSTDDVTRIMAGHDIVDTPFASNGNAVLPALTLSGPGTFDIEAAHNIGPLTNGQNVFVATNGQTAGNQLGIEAVGNADNPNLPHESAAINVLFGTGPGIDLQGFIAKYIAPTGGVGDVAPATQALIAFMENYDAGTGVDTGLTKDKAAAQAKAGTLTAAEAWAQFQTLPRYVQQMFAEQTLFAILTKVGQDFNDPKSPDAGRYERGYRAINTLFPAALGYTANNLEGGGNGANQLVDTGDLDIRSTTIQTQQGGNITILGPGGQALIGSTSAPPAIVQNGIVLAGPGTQGVLTLEQGDINIFTDRSVLLAQSRIFTEQGGAMTIWSSNGDINAGKGSKQSADIPPPMYVCDVNHYCTEDARGEVTGAGIATLQTIPGAPASDANLIAPRGTVDAGDAGIRVSGNLNVAALHVANADNIQVQGKSTGIPIVATVNVSALTSASAVATAAADAAENLGRQQQAAARQALPSIITVQVLGFGAEPVNGGSPVVPATPQTRPSGPQATGYDPRSALQVVGHGALTPEQLASLSQAAHMTAAELQAAQE